MVKIKSRANVSADIYFWTIMLLCFNGICCSDSKPDSMGNTFFYKEFDFFSFEGRSLLSQPQYPYVEVLLTKEKITKIILRYSEESTIEKNISYSSDGIPYTKDVYPDERGGVNQDYTFYERDSIVHLNYLKQDGKVALQLMSLDKRTGRTKWIFDILSSFSENKYIEPSPDVVKTVFNNKLIYKIEKVNYRINDGFLKEDYFIEYPNIDYFPNKTFDKCYNLSKMSFSWWLVLGHLVEIDCN